MTQTDSVKAETQDYGTSAGEIGTENASSKTVGRVEAVHDTRTQDICEGKVNNGKEPMDCTQKEMRISNQALTHSSSPQFQTSTPSVEQSSGSEDNAVDSSPEPQLGIEQFLFCATAHSNAFWILPWFSSLFLFLLSLVS